ncbi:hypothetical protein BH11PLA2_BH11PLA2_24620 [soil metagenome]
MSNLQKRLITGTALTLGMTAILFGDGVISIKPFLPLCMMVLALVTCLEFFALEQVPQTLFYRLFPSALITAIGLQWFVYYIHVLDFSWSPVLLASNDRSVPVISIATLIVYFFAAVSLLILDSITTHSGKLGSRGFVISCFVFAYLVLPALSLMKIQHMPDIPTTLALAVTIFVPKLGDVGAFFTGTFLGKHKMAPRLSPKKTWEGFAGGMVVAMLTAVGINEIGPEPLFKGGVLQAMLFGLVVGIAGVLGDLFESLIKRRANAKDASASVPGFGGVLDVVDSVLFAAPTAYLFFVLM